MLCSGWQLIPFVRNNVQRVPLISTLWGFWKRFGVSIWYDFKWDNYINMTLSGMDCTSLLQLHQNQVTCRLFRKVQQVFECLGCAGDFRYTECAMNGMPRVTQVSYFNTCVTRGSAPSLHFHSSRHPICMGNFKHA